MVCNGKASKDPLYHCLPSLASSSGSTCPPGHSQELGKQSLTLPVHDQSLAESAGVELGAGAVPEGCSEHIPSREESGSQAENTHQGSRTTLSLVLAAQHGPVDSHGEILHGHVLLCLLPLFCVPFGPGASGGLQCFYFIKSKCTFILRDSAQLNSRGYLNFILNSHFMTKHHEDVI